MTRRCAVKPVAVGGSPASRGVVAAASYEARKFGVRSAIPMSSAVRLCPQLIIVRPDFHKYQQASRTVFSIFRSVTPLVEPLSLDEAYLDVTENAWGEPLGRRVAERLKLEIKETTGLTASAGVAPNKFLAKIASGWRKPDGLTVIAPERVEKFLQTLPVDALWGVGPVTAERLRERGIHKLVDVRTADPACCEKRSAVAPTGSACSRTVWTIAKSNRTANPSRRAARTPTPAISPISFEMQKNIDEMARDAAAWLQSKPLLCRTVTIKVRYSDFTTITRSHTAPATRDPEDIARRAVLLLEKRKRANARSACSGRAFTTSSTRLMSRSPPLPFDG